MSYIKNVPSVNGSNLKETIDQIDKNFRTLCNDGVFKGDPGEGYMSKTLQLWSASDNVITIHNEDVLKTIFGADVWEKVKGWAASDFEMLDIPKDWTLYPGNPLWYVQNPSAYNLFLSLIGEGADYSCMVAVDGGFSDGNYTYKRYDIVPQLYREESTGNYCWKINGVKTGISASNNPDINGVRNVRFYLIKNTGTDEIPSYLYLTSVDGTVEWRVTADIDPVVGDFAWELSRETVSVSGSEQTASVLKVCMYNGYKWSPATADAGNKNYFLSYDDAMMLYVWGEVYGGLGDAYSESIAPVENHSFCFRTKDKDGNDVGMTHMISSKYNDIYKDTDPGSDLVIKAPARDKEEPCNLVITGYDGVYTSSIGVEGLPPEDSKLITSGELDVVKNDLTKAIDNRLFKKISWRALKDLRDEGNLVPGTRYCITDYVCGAQCYDAGTVYDNEKSFYIITTALTTNTLDENVRVAEKDPSNPVFPYNDLSKWEVKYSIDSHADKYDWVTTTTMNDISKSNMPNLPMRCIKITLKDTHISICGKCRFAIIGNERGTIYYLYKLDDLTKAKLINVVSVNHQLSEYKDLIQIDMYLYSSNAQTSWTPDLTDYNLVYVDKNIPYSIDLFLDNISISFRDYDTKANGNYSHGVIYYMKDDRGLAAPYDFKNILFADQDKAFNPTYPKAGDYPYTFNQKEYVYEINSSGNESISDVINGDIQADTSKYVGMINCSVGEDYITTRDIYGSYKNVGYTLGRNRMKSYICASPVSDVISNRVTFHDNHIENGCSECLIISDITKTFGYREKNETIAVELYNDIIHGKCKNCIIIDSNRTVLESGCYNCELMLCENVNMNGDNIYADGYVQSAMKGITLAFKNCDIHGHFGGRQNTSNIQSDSIFEDVIGRSKTLTVGSDGYVSSSKSYVIIGKSYRAMLAPSS